MNRPRRAWKYTEGGRAQGEPLAAQAQLRLGSTVFFRSSTDLRPSPRRCRMYHARAHAAPQLPILCVERA